MIAVLGVGVGVVGGRRPEKVQRQFEYIVRICSSLIVPVGASKAPVGCSVLDKCRRFAGTHFAPTGPFHKQKNVVLGKSQFYPDNIGKKTSVYAKSV